MDKELSSRYLLLLLLYMHLVQAQTYTGCHNHSSTEYCYGPDGRESPVYTFTSPMNAAAPSGATTPATIVADTTSAAAQTTAVTDCHLHGTATYCINGNSREVEISATGTQTGEPPAQYTDCHAHGTEQYCMDPDGGEVLVLDTSSEGLQTEDPGEENCHFHAGVEHCTSPGESESESASSLSCELRQREYDVPLRIGTLFVIFVTSGIAVFGPVLLTTLFHVAVSGLVFTVIKQFGTGIILSTALIHLVTHAQLMFANPCLGELEYEATTSAIVLAGLFLSFLVDYAGQRVVSFRASGMTRNPNGNDLEHTEPKGAAPGSTPRSDSPTSGANGPGRSRAILAYSDDKLSVLTMEAGIIFHSAIIGVTLIVAGDSFYITLFIVVMFHQMFEGLALGARISSIKEIGLLTQSLMAVAFALVTPVGMAIGLGVLNSFNGNAPGTIIALGTLDALSAGILLWAGIVDMWSHDWVYGSLRDSGILTTAVAMTSLVAGMVAMSVLGKWA